MRHKSVSHFIKVPLIFEIEISFYNIKTSPQLDSQKKGGGLRSRESRSTGPTLTWKLWDGINQQSTDCHFKTSKPSPWPPSRPKRPKRLPHPSNVFFFLKFIKLWFDQNIFCTQSVPSFFERHIVARIERGRHDKTWGGHVRGKEIIFDQVWRQTLRFNCQLITWSNCTISRKLIFKFIYKKFHSLLTPIQDFNVFLQLAI